MTISSTNRKAGPFVGNGATVTFPFTFKVFAAGDLVVTEAVTATGVETTLVLTTDYTVSLNADQNASPGGSITLGVAPSAAQTVTITSGLALLQQTSLANQGGFYPSVINDALDRLTIFAQQLQEQVSRSFKVQLSTSSAITPSVAVMANGILTWDAAGVNLVTIGRDTLAAALIFDNTTYQAAIATSMGALGVDLSWTTDNAKDVGTAAHRPRDINAGRDVNVGRNVNVAGVVTAKGVTDGSSAAAGGLGEYISASVNSGSAVSLTSSTAANVVSISLTAGDWDVWGAVGFRNANPSMAAVAACITTTSGTLTSDGTQDGSQLELPVSLGGNYVGNALFPLGHRRINVSVTTTVYVVAQATFATSCSAIGSIAARRAR